MNEFKKFDGGKPQMDMLLDAPIALENVAKVMQYGATKYAKRNWRLCTELSRYEAALLRHLTAWHNGETVDPETGLSHLAHMCCNAVFLTELGIARDEQICTGSNVLSEDKISELLGDDKEIDDLTEQVLLDPAVQEAFGKLQRSRDESTRAWLDFYNKKKYVPKVACDPAFTCVGGLLND